MKRSIAYGIQDIFRDISGRRAKAENLREDEFWSLQDVSFSLKAGETLGILGSNGSGKSTLLKLLSGIIKPDRGRIEIQGRLGALIEVGAGFHPMLTGRENIYINGTILGMSRAEIRRKFESIVEFAEVGPFIDMPVKNYSSGMYVRLGFSIAAHCEPDVLLVDEVLAVGDLAFQAKCNRYIEERILDRGVLLCLVSHNIHTITRLCSKALILDRGNLRYIGDTEGAVPEYYRVSRSPSIDRKAVSLLDLPREGAGEIRVADLQIKDHLGNSLARVQAGEPFRFQMTLKSARDFAYAPVIELRVLDLSGTVLAYFILHGASRHGIEIRRGENVLHCDVDFINLIPGKYVLEAKIGGGNDTLQDYYRNAREFEVQATDDVYRATLGAGLVYFPHRWGNPMGATVP